jgi:hypothetical protein
MRHVLPDLDHVTPAWLPEMLQHQGHLQAGCVTAVHLTKTMMRCMRQRRRSSIRL